jgi:hypothetical protein
MLGNSLKKIVFFLFLMSFISLSRASSLDGSISNAVAQVIIPIGSEVVLEDISPNASDPSLLLRITAMSSNAWFDAIAPYHPTAKGVYTSIPNRPSSEWTDENRNIAMLYASYHVYNSLMPHRQEKWKKMLFDVGLDPEDASTDPVSPIGIGNLVGKAIVDARKYDGMNQLGDEGGCQYNCLPYSDYTGYKPKNTAYKLRKPSRWQPDILSNNFGQFYVQQFVTAHFGKTQPYTYKNPNKFLAPRPYNSNVSNFYGYKMQADEVLNASASMTDEQKAMAELFDNKFNSVLAAAGSVSGLLDLSLEEFVHIEFATNIASFDTAIAIWHNKRKYDSVRPFSAIKFIYGHNYVSAWGGVGKGTVHDLPANQWKSYLPVANHPEYPSATASICSAHAQVMRRMYGDDNLDFSVYVPAGSSRIEPGITPQYDITLNWTSWSDFENDCGQSRLWSGVHFPDSIPAGADIGHEIADLTFEYMQDLLNGIK